MRIEIWQDLTAEGRRAVLARPALANDASSPARVAAIIERVRSEGDAALLDLTAKLDRVELASLEVGQAEFAAAGDRLSDAQRAAIRAAAANIEAFHEPQLPVPLGGRYGARRALRARLAADRERRALRAGGQRAAALHCADARRARAARRLPYADSVHPAAGGRPRGPGRALCGARERRAARVQARRRAGDRSARLRHRDGAEGRQGLRPRQRLGHRGQGAGRPRPVRRRARLSGRPVRGARDRRRDARTRRSSRPTSCRRPSTAPTRRCCCSRRAPTLAVGRRRAGREPEGDAAAPRDRRRRARDTRAPIVVADLAEAFEISNALRAGALDPARSSARATGCRECARRAPCSSGRGRPRPSATIAAARTTCCRPTASRGAIRASASAIFCAR